MSGPQLQEQKNEQPNLQEITPEVRVESVAEPKKPESRQLVPISIGESGVQLTNMDSAIRFCEAVIKSGLAPYSFDTVAKVFIAIQTGSELGLTPMSSLNSLIVIDGKVSMYSQTAFALIKSKGVLEDYKEELIGQEDERKAKVTTKRKGIPTPLVTEFSVSDAKKANLWGKIGRSGKPSAWVTYPDRMLLARARGFNASDGYSDILKGMKTAEELEDFSVEVEKTGPKLAD